METITIEAKNINKPWLERVLITPTEATLQTYEGNNRWETRKYFVSPSIDDRIHRVAQAIEHWPGRQRLDVFQAMRRLADHRGSCHVTAPRGGCDEAKRAIDLVRSIAIQDRLSSDEVAEVRAWLKRLKEPHTQTALPGASYVEYDYKDAKLRFVMTAKGRVDLERWAGRVWTLHRCGPHPPYAHVSLVEKLKFICMFDGVPDSVINRAAELVRAYHRALHSRIAQKGGA